MIKRKGSAQWIGTGLEGQGTVSVPSKVLQNTPYSFTARFKNESGVEGTNPEELIASAHASCFAMALSFQLNGAGFTAEKLIVEAVVSIDKDGEGFSIKGIELLLVGKVPNISKERFLELAEIAKKGCPISKLFNAPISLTSQLL
ncbi:MAG: OsmC family protein [Limnohabitans sp.]|nr:OsmC family protein [Limnohabitans sp.]